MLKKSIRPKNPKTTSKSGVILRTPKHPCKKQVQNHPSIGGSNRGFLGRNWWHRSDMEVPILPAPDYGHPLFDVSFHVLVKHDISGNNHGNLRVPPPNATTPKKLPALLMLSRVYFLWGGWHSGGNYP